MEYKDQKYTYLGGLIHDINTLATSIKISVKTYFHKKVAEQYLEDQKELKIFDRFRGTLVMSHNENSKHHCVARELYQIVYPNDTVIVASEAIETKDGKEKKILVRHECDLGTRIFCQLCINTYPHDTITFDQNFERTVSDRMRFVLQLNHAGDKVTEEEKEVQIQDQHLKQ